MNYFYLSKDKSITLSEIELNKSVGATSARNNEYIDNFTSFNSFIIVSLLYKIKNFNFKDINFVKYFDNVSFNFKFRIFDFDFIKHILLKTDKDFIKCSKNNEIKYIIKQHSLNFDQYCKNVIKTYKNENIYSNVDIDKAIDKFISEYVEINNNYLCKYKIKLLKSEIKEKEIEIEKLENELKLY